jgi:hypothetical protein
VLAAVPPIHAGQVSYYEDKDGLIVAQVTKFTLLEPQLASSNTAEISANTLDASSKKGCGANCGARCGVDAKHVSSFSGILELANRRRLTLHDLPGTATLYDLSETASPLRGMTTSEKVLPYLTHLPILTYDASSKITLLGATYGRSTIRVLILDVQEEAPDTLRVCQQSTVTPALLGHRALPLMRRMLVESHQPRWQEPAVSSAIPQAELPQHGRVREGRVTFYTLPPLNDLGKCLLKTNASGRRQGGVIRGAVAAVKGKILTLRMEEGNENFDVSQVRTIILTEMRPKDGGRVVERTSITLPYSLKGVLRQIEPGDDVTLMMAGSEVTGLVLICRAE